MNKLIVLVGLPASGKSSYAKQHLANENTIILSSDILRKELFGNECCQDNNELVFRTLYKRAKEELLNSNNVVVDATNINMKARRNILSNFSKMNIERKAIVFATPLETCIERDRQRERTVGEDVIKKFLYNFEIPMEYEGFDDIQIIESPLKFCLYSAVKASCGFHQENPHHKYTLEEHSEICFLAIARLSDNDNLKAAALIHDIGKLYTQTFDNNGIAHYYSHHNVGAYMFMCSDSKKAFERERIFYINFHMLPFFWKEDKTREKYCKLFGNKLFDNLMLLHICDKIASGTEEVNDE